MKKKGYTAEQIIGKLREAEVLLSQGSTVGEASRKLGVTEQTYYRWRREYGGTRIESSCLVPPNLPYPFLNSFHSLTCSR